MTLRQKISHLFCRLNIHAWQAEQRNWEDGSHTYECSVCFARRRRDSDGRITRIASMRSKP